MNESMMTFQLQNRVFETFYLTWWDHKNVYKVLNNNNRDSLIIYTNLILHLRSQENEIHKVQFISNKKF